MIRKSYFWIGCFLTAQVFFAAPLLATSDKLTPVGTANSKEYVEEQTASGEMDVAKKNEAAQMYDHQAWPDRLVMESEIDGKLAVETHDKDRNGKIDLVVLDRIDGDENVLSTERWHIDETDESVSRVERGKQ